MVLNASRLPTMASFEEMHSLSRYYGWCDLMKRHFAEAAQQMSSGTGDVGVVRLLAQAYMCYWYGGLYVVIEGYQRLKLADSVVDKLLSSPNTGLLKGFRHGVFHYQRKYFDERFMNLITQGESVRPWVQSLHREFDRLFAAHSASLTPKNQSTT